MEVILKGLQSKEETMQEWNARIQHDTLRSGVSNIPVDRQRDYDNDLL